MHYFLLVKNYTKQLLLEMKKCAELLSSSDCSMVKWSVC